MHDFSEIHRKFQIALEWFINMALLFGESTISKLDFRHVYIGLISNFYLTFI